MSGTQANQTDVQASGNQASVPTKKNNKGASFFKKQSRPGSGYKGSVEGMNGHVFQTYAEQSKRGEFQRTLDELQVYCSTTYVQEAGLLEPLFSRLENPTLDRPLRPIFSTDEDLNNIEEEIYKEELKAYVRTKNSLKATLHSLFNVVWGQCSMNLRSKLESKNEFKDIRENKDVGGLLKQIKAVVHQFETHTSIYEALDEAKKNYYHYYQGPRTSNTQHVKNLQDMVDIIEYHGGSVTDDQALVDYERSLEAHLPVDQRPLRMPSNKGQRIRC